MKFAAPTAAAAVAAGVLAIATPASAAVHHHHTVTVDEQQNHGTVTVHKGDRIRLVLHSTYWAIDRAHGHALQSRKQHADPQLGPGCVPGGGCGTVTRTFIARHSGTAHLVAGRTSCGEAMRCTDDQGSFRITVRVR